MTAGTLLAEVQDSSLALAIILGFIALMVYRKPLGVLLNRMGHFSLRRGDTELTAKAMADPTPSARTSPSDEKAEIDEEPRAALVTPEDGEDSLTPSEPSALRARMISLLFDRNEDEARKVWTRLEEVEPDQNKRKADRARWEAIRHMTGSGGSEAMEVLHRLTEDEAVQGTAWLFIGHCHVHSGELRRARQDYEKAASTAKDQSVRVQAITSLAEAQAKAGDADLALQTVSTAIRDTSDEELLFDLWQGLADIHDAKGDQERRGIALQKALELKSHDSRVRFRAAWALSEGNSALAPLVAHHYEALLRFTPDDATALNNYGVQMERLDMPIQAISLYRESAQHQYSLAMANLAYQFMGAGFESEASELLTAASTQENPHKNVAAAAAALAKRKEVESETKEKILASGQELAEFMRDFGTAMVQEDSVPVGGIWKWDDDSVEVSVQSPSARRVEITWMEGSTAYEFSVETQGQSGRGAFSKKAKGDYWLHKEAEAFVVFSPRGDSMKIAKLKDAGVSVRTLRQVGV